MLRILLVFGDYDHFTRILWCRVVSGYVLLVHWNSSTCRIYVFCNSSLLFYPVKQVRVMQRKVHLIDQIQETNLLLQIFFVKILIGINQFLIDDWWQGTEDMVNHAVILLNPMSIMHLQNTGSCSLNKAVQVIIIWPVVVKKREIQIKPREWSDTYTLQCTWVTEWSGWRMALAVKIKEWSIGLGQVLCSIYSFCLHLNRWCYYAMSLNCSCNYSAYNMRLSDNVIELLCCHYFILLLWLPNDNLAYVFLGSYAVGSASGLGQGVDNILSGNGLLLFCIGYE